jgi:hypothetical protein
MFTPTLSPQHRRKVSHLQLQLAKVLEPAITEESPKLKPLVAKQSELTAEIARIERGASAADLEESGHQLANRKAQLHLVELQIKALQDERDKAAELARQKRAQALQSLGAEAVALLADIAGSFQRQHQDALEAAISQYAVCHSAEARNLIRMIPWFLQYLRNIRAFRDNGATPDLLLEWLGAALENKDFLMLPKS